MKKILALAVAGPAIAVAMPAFAQESPEATFTGPRVEAILGYDILKAGSSIDGTYDENNSIDGLLYGAGVGYDFDLGGIVIGAEGEITDSTAKSRFADNGEIEDFGYGLFFGDMNEKDVERVFSTLNKTVRIDFEMTILKNKYKKKRKRR